MGSAQQDDYHGEADTRENNIEPRLKRRRLKKRPNFRKPTKIPVDPLAQLPKSPSTKGCDFCSLS